MFTWRWVHIGLLGVACFVSVITLSGCSQHTDPSKTGGGELEGPWKVVAWEQDGKAVDVASRYNKVVISGEKYTGYQGDEVAAFFILKLNGSRNPKHVDFTHPEEKEPFLGIYAREGNELKLCWDGARPGQRPTNFSGAGTQMYIRVERSKAIP